MKTSYKKHIYFGKRERRAVLFLLPVVAVVVLILVGFARHNKVKDSEIEDWTQTHRDDMPVRESNLFEFDPNTVTYEELRELGIPKGTAAGIIKYRSKGKVFEIEEDFAACYGISDSMYAVLKPYIIIAEEFRSKPVAASNNYYAGSGSSGGSYVQRNSATELQPFDPNALDADGFRALGFSVRQAAAIVKYRDMRGGFRSAGELSECYVVSPEKFKELTPYIVINAGQDTVSDNASADGRFVELNGADSVTLIGIRGIGPKSASQIIAYRNRLGGFHSVEQLTELRVITESNYEQICKQIRIDSYVIQKIDINFATPEELGRHPYLVPKLLRRILKNRQLKGGWCTIDDMINDGTLSVGEAENLAPYLHFAPLATG